MRISTSLRRWASIPITFSLVEAAIGAAPASAASLTQTFITITSKNPKITYTDRHVTITGRLAEANKAATPLAGATLKVTELPFYADRWIDDGTTATGADGTFSITVTTTDLGQLRVGFVGDASHWPADSQLIYPSPSAWLPTRITLAPLQDSITAGSTLHFTGHVEMQTPDGNWIPARRLNMRITNGTWSGYAGQTDDNGNFTMSLPGVGMRNTGSGWGVASDTDPNYNWAAGAHTPLTPVAVTPAQTRITGFTAGPNPATAQNGLSFTGHVDALIDGQWQGNTDSQGALAPLALYYQPKGSTTWIQATTAYFWRGPNPGDFHIDALPSYLWNGTGYYLTQGSWQVRVQQWNNIWQASSTDGKPIDVHVKTTINGLRIRHWGPHNQRRSLIGSLAIQPGPGLPTGLPTALPAQTITVYYRAKGSKTWHPIALTKTDNNGLFTFSLTQRPHGYYRAVFTSNSYYDATNSPTLTFAN